MSKLTIQRGRTDQNVLETGLSDVNIANTFFKRLVGLLFYRGLRDDQALLIEPCGSVHTFFMRFSLDIVFLDCENNVLALAESVHPNRVRVGPKGSVKVLELADGNVKKTGIHLDDILIFD